MKESNRQHWPNSPTGQTGTRLVKMEVKHPIPLNLSIGGISVKVWCRGQPVKCDICSVMPRRNAP